MARLARYPLSIAIVSVAFVATAGVFLFARPGYHPRTGLTIKLPAKHPANDLAGAAGWVWPDGTPGWTAGYTVKGYNVSGLQPVEIEASQLAAARKGLDSTGVRVLVAARASTRGALAILAAPTLEQTPTRTCLAALLEGNEPVRWECPGATPSRSDLARAHVLVAASATVHGMSSLVGVARGDVSRVVLKVPGRQPWVIYERGTTWGQFEAGVTAGTSASLQVYGRHGLVETLPLDLRPGEQRVLR